MGNQNKILAWLAVILALGISISVVMSFEPAKGSVDLRGAVFFLFLVPIGFSVFFLTGFESLIIGIAVFAAGVYSACITRYAATPYYSWPVDKGFMEYAAFIAEPLFTSGIIWELILFSIVSYWLGALSEKMRDQKSRYNDSFARMDELAFQVQQERVRYISLQKKYDEDVNRLNSLIIMLSELAKEIPSVLEIEGLFKLLLDKSVKLFSAINCAIFLVDEQAGRLKYVCSTGYDQASIASMDLAANEESGLPGWCAKNAKFLSAIEMEKNPYMADIVNQNKFPVEFCQPIVDNGKSIAVVCIGSTEREFSAKEIIHLASILANISTIAIRNARLMEKTKEQAIKDGLTGLYNHGYFYELLEDIMKKTRHEGFILGVFLIDIDHFKKFNDTYGHQLGDMILQETAKIVQKQIHKTDIAARYGGEEFAIICVRKDAQDINKMAEEIRKTVEESVFQQGSLKLSVTISVGVAFYDLKTGFIASELVKHSDEALYKAKESGRNRICFYGDNK